MGIYKLLNRTKILILWLSTLLSLSMLLCFPTECRNGGANGVFLCIQVLIPSLFPYMMLSSFVASSGMAARVPKWICRIVSKIFGLSDCCTTVLILTLIGGYPVGASTIKALSKEKFISAQDAQRMALFCVASGPGFLVTYIGASMTRNLRMGYILLVSQTIAVLLLGILAKHIIKYERPIYVNVKQFNSKKSIKYAFISSLENSITSCGKMCALVIIFGAVSEVYITLCKNNSALIWMSALLEITNGTKILCTGYPTILISAVCGFGGICVHLQIFSALSDIDFSKCLFYIFRILQGILNAAITYILLKFFPVTQTVFSSVTRAEPKLYTTSIGCIALIVVSIAFIISVKSKSYIKQN